MSEKPRTPPEVQAAIDRAIRQTQDIVDQLIQKELDNQAADRQPKNTTGRAITVRFGARGEILRPAAGMNPTERELLRNLGKPSVRRRT